MKNGIPAVLTLLLAIVLGPVPSQGQTPEALAAWDTYVEWTEVRIGEETANDDGWPSRIVETPRNAPSNGSVWIEELETRTPDGDEIDIPDAMVHHWRGAVFVPNTDLETVLGAVRHPERDVDLQEDVLEARVLERSNDGLRVFLKLSRSKIVTAVYNTEHVVRFRRHDARHATSRTEAVRIAELDRPGTAGEREKAPGDDRGFLWKLNSYWSYEEADGGVLILCESVSLSRSIPFLVRPIVSPIVTGVARESLERTLVSLRERLVAASADEGRTASGPSTSDSGI